MKRYLIYKERRPPPYGDKVLVITGLPDGARTHVPGCTWHWSGSAAFALARDPIARGTDLSATDSVFFRDTYIEIEEARLADVMRIVLQQPEGTDLSRLPEVRGAIIPYGSAPTTRRQDFVPKTNHKIGVPKNRLP